MPELTCTEILLALLADAPKPEPPRDVVGCLPVDASKVTITWASTARVAATYTLRCDGKFWAGSTTISVTRKALERYLRTVMDTGDYTLSIEKEKSNV